MADSPHTLIRATSFDTLINFVNGYGGYGYHNGAEADDQYVGFDLPSTGDHEDDDIYGTPFYVEVGGIRTRRVGNTPNGSWQVVLDGHHASFPTNYEWTDTFVHTGTPSGVHAINAALLDNSPWLRVELTSPDRTRWTRTIWGSYADATDYSPTITVTLLTGSNLTMDVTQDLTFGLTSDLAGEG